MKYNKSRIAFCQACSNEAHGVKARIAVEHTCGIAVPVSEVEKKEEEKKFKVEGVPDDVLEKIIEKSSIWNDEIRPHFFKGMVLGWRMANKSPSVILTESLAGEAAHRYAAKVFDGCDREDQSEYDHFVNHLLSFIKSLNIKQ